ncbi:hypothetical protein LMG23994_04567 [Cupriavidus pinatubonensis]|uniref:DDE domain-containing protein n=1 Tax=Cupriavidus pinatubonensis TaxID=248026 RepID=A0ABM8XLH4_9BURK|nr:hypothetical protein LMG23994_04567 [Cupriavidus pinatubonensis]
MAPLQNQLIASSLRKILRRLHYPLEVILTCVRWYAAYPLSLRNLEEIMAERGVLVHHATVHRWAIKILPVLAKVFRQRKRPVGSSWRVDETYIKVSGQWKYLYRAVDRLGQTVDFRLTAKRDMAAARRFNRRTPGRFGVVPAGRSPSSATAERSASISSNFGTRERISHSPASIVDTLRVVRVSSRTPSLASKLRMEWLSADCVTPSLAAARVKLRSFATVINASRSLKLWRGMEWQRQMTIGVVAPSIERDGARDIAGAWRGEEEHGVRHLFRRGQAAQAGARVGARQCLLHCHAVASVQR